ncbi:MAG: fibronectin type III domain-containing protein [Limnochordales bacterium]|nr:fibronectin type III domain-containing protein [Limnochordales bacterium]
MDCVMRLVRPGFRAGVLLLFLTAAIHPAAGGAAGGTASETAMAGTDVLLADDFDVDRLGAVWTVVDDAPYAEGPSRWVVQGGLLLQLSNIYRSEREYDFWQGTHIVAGDPGWTDYSFSFDIGANDDNGIGGIIRYKDKDNYYRFIMLTDPTNRGPFRRLEKFVNGERVVLAEDDQPFTPSKVYHVEMVAVGDRLEVWLDGELLFAVRDDTFPAGKVGLLAYATNALAVDNVRVLRRQADPVQQGQGEPGRSDAAVSAGKVISVSLSNVGATSALVRWYTDQGTPDVEVLLTSADNPGERQVLPVTRESIAARQLMITGLLPETNYTVTVTSGGSSLSRSFRTRSLSIARGPYISLVTPSSITIAWESADTGEGRVEWWPADDPAYRHTLTVNAQAMSASQHYRAVLTGLKPFTAYSYYVAIRSGSKEARSQIYTFRTAPDNPEQNFVFNVYGDTQDRVQHQRVIEEMLKQPEVAFLLHQGDLVNAPPAVRVGQLLRASSADAGQDPLLSGLRQPCRAAPQLPGVLRAAQQRVLVLFRLWFGARDRP